MRPSDHARVLAVTTMLTLLACTSGGGRDAETRPPSPPAPSPTPAPPPAPLPTPMPVATAMAAVFAEAAVEQVPVPPDPTPAELEGAARDDRPPRPVPADGPLLRDESIVFSSGSASLDDDARRLLDLVGAEIALRPDGLEVLIVGHADRTGDADANHVLGLARAEAVRRYLHDQHEVPLDRIRVVSRGETDPLDGGTTEHGRARNRRVTLVISR